MVEWVQPRSDPGLQTLAEVFDSDAMVKQLRGACLGRHIGGAVEEVRDVPRPFARRGEAK